MNAGRPVSEIWSRFVILESADPEARMSVGRASRTFDIAPVLLILLDGLAVVLGPVPSIQRSTTP